MKKQGTFALLSVLALIAMFAFSEPKEKKLPVLLTIEKWNYVLNVLATRPKAEVDPVFTDIEQQLKAALKDTTIKK